MLTPFGKKEVEANFLSFVFNSDRPVRQCQSRYSFRSKRGGSLLTQSRPTGIVNCLKIAFYLNALCIYRVLMLTILNFLHRQRCYTINLFTDMATILNFLDLRSIMGFPGGTRSVFTRAFRAKRELQCILLRKKASMITSKHGTTIFFSDYNLFLRKLEEKLAGKAHVNTEQV